MEKNSGVPGNKDMRGMVLPYVLSGGNMVGNQSSNVLAISNRCAQYRLVSLSTRTCPLELGA